MCYVGVVVVVAVVVVVDDCLLWTSVFKASRSSRAKKNECQVNWKQP